MDNQDIRTLKLLEEIDSKPASSQRDLAQKLNISVGLVNSFVKRLVQKGYFKITTIPRNRARYILTPRGAAEKSRLTYEYIRYSIQFYKEARKNLQEVFKALVQKGVGRIVFYGVSDFTEIAFISVQETPMQIVAVVDDEKAGGKFLNYMIISSAELAQITYDKILITQMDVAMQLFERLKSQGVESTKIVTV